MTLHDFQEVTGRHPDAPRDFCWASLTTGYLGLAPVSEYCGKPRAAHPAGGLLTWPDPIPVRVVFVDRRGEAGAAYPHPTVAGPVTLAEGCPNALQIEEYTGWRDKPAYAGTCGLVGPDGGQCEWTSESHLTAESVEFVWAGHVAEEHKDGES